MPIPATEIPFFAASGSLPGVPPRKTRRKLLRWILTLLFLLLLASVLTLVGGAYYLVASQIEKEGGKKEAAVKFWLEPEKYVFGSKKRLNILCMGVDYNYDSKGMPYSKSARSDTMMLFSFDRQSKSVSVISIPRDLLVSIPGYGEDKINAAYALGGARLARKTVSNLLGVPVDYCMSVRVQAASQVVDALGGLTLDVEKKMDYDDNWGNLHIHLKKGRHKLNGKQVVGYCRFRHDEEGDLGRIRRQQQVIAALTRQLKTRVKLDTLPRLVKVFEKNVSTDLPKSRMLALGRIFRGMDRSRLRSARLEVSDAEYGGIMYLVPQTEANRALVRRLLTSPDDLPLSELTVEVLNGSGIEGAATRAADRLEREGFQVVFVGDAGRSDYPHSRVVDRVGSSRACQRMIGVVPAKVEQGTPGPASPDLTLVIGRDIKSHN